jgi:hypothetical protein
VFTASHENVNRPTLDKPGVPFRPGSRSFIIHVAEHSINVGYNIQFEDTNVLDKVFGGMEVIIRENTDTELHSGNMKREECFSLSLSFKP